MSKIEVAKLGAFTGHKDCIYTVEKGESPNCFFSSGSDGLIVYWDLNQPDQGQLVAKIPNTVYALNYVREQQLLLAGQNFSGIHIIDCQTWKETHSIKLSSQAIFDIKHRGTIAYIASGEGNVQAVDFSDVPKVLWKSEASTQAARCLSIHPNKQEIAVGYSDNHIRILDLHSGELKMERRH